MSGLLRGCPVLPPTLEDQVRGALRAPENRLPGELASLRNDLAVAGTSQEGIALVERSVVTFRRVERLELGAINGLDTGGRVALEGMNAGSWNRIVSYGRSRIGAYRAGGRSRISAVSSLKGIAAEQVFNNSGDFASVLARAQERVRVLGYAEDSLRTVEGARGITLSDQSARFLNHGELTDGLITATRRPRLTAEELDARRLLQQDSAQFQWAVSRRGVAADPAEDLGLLSMLEMKSPSNVEQLARNHGDNWLGQVGNNFERFHELPFYDASRGIWYPPSQVQISLYRTEIVVVVPHGYTFPDAVLGRFARKPTIYNLPIPNAVLNEVAERVFTNIFRVR